jgi:hypothetical protein
MQYFKKEGKMNKHKGAGKGKECNSSAMLCHLENKKREGDFLENAGDT